MFKGPLKMFDPGTHLPGNQTNSSVQSSLIVTEKKIKNYNSLYTRKNKPAARLTADPGGRKFESQPG